MKGKLKRILVGTDFSRMATIAVERASLIAAEHGARLEIVHVEPSFNEGVLKRYGLDVVIDREPDPYIERKLDETVSVARSHNINTTAKIMKGSVAANLTKESDRFAADLVVVGARGDHSIKYSVIGTTAERLIEKSNRDILVVRTPAKTPYRNILICVALGPVSGCVVEAAIGLAVNADLHLIHVYEPIFERKLINHGANSEAIMAHRQAAKQEAARGVAELVEKCFNKMKRHPTTMLRIGNPPSSPAYMVLVGAANQLKTDVVAIGKKQSIIKGILWGNTSKHVLRAASTDILISSNEEYLKKLK